MFEVLFKNFKNQVNLKFSKIGLYSNLYLFIYIYLYIFCVVIMLLVWIIFLWYLTHYRAPPLSGMEEIYSQSIQ